VLVFADGDRSMGLMVDEILDVVDEKLAVELAADRPGLLGTAVIAGHATEVIDAGYWLRQAFDDWFEKKGPGEQKHVQPRLLVVEDSQFFRELLTPLLVGPLLTSLLKALRIASPLREGLSVVVLYLALMAGPLLILSLMLRSLGPAPEGGWLLLRWRPLGSGIQRALRSVLMVVPLVSLVGWLQGQIWGDPGGSNPLLDLVLRSQDPATLACFAIGSRTDNLFF
jgi:hypothetical protein